MCKFSVTNNQTDIFVQQLATLVNWHMVGHLITCFSTLCVKLSLGFILFLIKTWVTDLLKLFRNSVGRPQPLGGK
jgi:hypothetical protein